MDAAMVLSGRCFIRCPTEPSSVRILGE